MLSMMFHRLKWTYSICYILAICLYHEFQHICHFDTTFFELCGFKTSTGTKRINIILRNFTCWYQNTSYCNSQNCKSMYKLPLFGIAKKNPTTFEQGVSLPMHWKSESVNTSKLRRLDEYAVTLMLTDIFGMLTLPNFEFYKLDSR